MAFFRVALSGGIGSGKTAVTDFLAAHGITILDADVFAHRVTASGEAAVVEIAGAFGPSVLTPSGDLNRVALRDLVFADETKRRALEAIVHPKVRAAMNEAADEASGPYVVFSIPLLVETGQAERFDHVVIVEAPIALRAARVKKRSGLNQESFEKICLSQASDEERAALADDLIVNDGTLDALKIKTDALHQKLLSLAAAKNG